MNEPKDFKANSPDNILNEMDISFENVCTALEEAGVLKSSQYLNFKVRLYTLRVKNLNKLNNEKT